MSSFALEYASVQAWCARMGLAVNTDDANRQVLIPRGPDQEPVRIVSLADRNMMMFLMVVPITVPPGRYTEVSRAIALANAQSFMGCWVLTTSRGELYFRITLPTDGHATTDDGLTWVIRVLAGTFDTLAPALRRVALEDAAAETVRDVPVGR